MRKILVPTDFSNPAILATEVAIEIAKKANAEIVLLHVIEIPSDESFNAEGQVSQWEDWEDTLFTMKLIDKSKKQLLAACKNIEEEGLQVSYKLKIGNTFHGMRTSITEEKADLVVMGTSGRSRLEEMIIGSNTEKVVRHAKCPVLTIHEKSKGADFQNIVYATSMSEDEKDFSNIIINAQEMYGAKIHLVRVNTPINFKPDVVVKEIMEKFAKNLRLKNYTVNVFSDYSEEEGIIHFANSIDADLIALSTHGRTGFAHLIAGSIAEDVANHSRKPVLTYVTKQASS
jgi:nucleotide-binding universal stress UspA family protein